MCRMPCIQGFDYTHSRPLHTAAWFFFVSAPSAAVISSDFNTVARTIGALPWSNTSSARFAIVRVGPATRPLCPLGFSTSVDDADDADGWLPRSSGVIEI